MRRGQARAGPRPHAGFHPSSTYLPAWVRVAFFDQVHDHVELVLKKSARKKGEEEEGGRTSRGVSLREEKEKEGEKGAGTRSPFVSFSSFHSRSPTSLSGSPTGERLNIWQMKSFKSLPLTNSLAPSFKG